jgi:hypothetical protein
MYIDPQKAINQISRAIGKHKNFALKNLNWLLESMNPYFFITFGPEKDALLNLSMNLQTLGENHRYLIQDPRFYKGQRDYLFRNDPFQYLSAGPGWRA